ncbi:MAG: ABC transporter permease subunit [Bacteroidales bacterium]|nr:ABC transporter permease subunit [Bacteroidales bacterium]
MRALRYTLLLLAVLTGCAGKQDASESLPACLEDLSGHTVAVPGGGSTDLYLSQYEGIDLMRIGIGDMALAVKSRRAEFAMMQEDQYDATQMDRQGFRKCFNGVLEGAVAVALRKDEQKVCDDFNRFLRAMRASGEYDRWHQDWLHHLDSMVMEAVKIPAPRTGKKINVGITIVFPYIFLSNETLSGMEIDLFNRFCRSEGYCPEYSIIQFPALIPSLNAHKIDAILSHLTTTAERAKQVLFTDEYLESGLCCFCLDPEREEDSAGLRIWNRIRDSFRTNMLEENRWKLLASGLVATLEISLFSLLLAIVVGAFLCYLRMRPNRIVNTATRVFVDTVRGIPVLVILMILFYVIFAKVRLSGVSISIFGFGLFFGACFCEVFRTGMLSVDRGQWEAGSALGLNKMQVFRLIVLPQALKRIVPVFKGEVITLIKSTAVVGYVAVMDLTCAGDIIRARTMDAFFPLILISVIYILLSRLSGGLLDALDRKLNSSK